MIYPKHLEKGNIIGVAATSDGVTDELDVKRFENAVKNLNERGYEVIFTNNVFMADKQFRSSSGKQRGQEFNELVSNDKVSAVIAAKGGNFLNEMLEYVDYENFCRNPKWFQGYSDNTGLMHTLTTRCDVAAIYSSNFGEFGMNKWHRSVEDNLNVLEGKELIQNSYDKYQQEMTERITGLEGYECDAKAEWKLDFGTLKRTDNVVMSGRLIGGCLDVLLFLQGTKYDGTMEFIEKYKEDGIIWYLETFDISGENIMMFLWKLKQIGWFKYTKGFMFGRPLFYKDFTNSSYEEAVMYALGNLDVPVIFDCDFGHRGPRMTIINGALATVQCTDRAEASIEYKIK